MSEKNAGTDRQSVLLENMPRDLVQRFKARCADASPPATMRATIERLIRDYLDNVTTD